MGIQQMIQERNELLMRMFENFLGNQVRLYGDENTPYVILNNKWILPCYVKNFDVFFAEDKDRGKVLFRHKMTSDNPTNFVDEKMFWSWYNNSERAECFNIKIKGTNLFISGYNHYQHAVNGNKVRYPVYAEYEPLIFYKKDFAEKILQDIMQRGAPITQSLEIF